MRVRCRSLGTMLFVASLSGLVIPGIIPIKATSYVPHSPILIDGNGNFTAANGVSSGSGTMSDPYIIQGWDINASGLPCCYAWGNAGLLVQNTNASFIIRNVHVHSGLPLSLGINLLRFSNSLVVNSVEPCRRGEADHRNDLDGKETGIDCKFSHRSCCTRRLSVSPCLCTFNRACRKWAH